MEWLLIASVGGVNALVMRRAFGRKATWPELGLPVAVAAVTMLGSVYVGRLSVVADREYWGGWVEEARYYEDWNEYVHQTCTRTSTDSDGNVTTTTYDCSYVMYHPEQWVFLGSNGEQMNVGRDSFEAATRTWGVSPRFVEMHRDYHTDDGDMYVATWTGSEATLWPWFTEHIYENRLMNSDSALRPSPLSKDELKAMRPPEYPRVTGTDLRFVIGDWPSGTAEAERFLDVRNALEGRQKKLITFVIGTTEGREYAETVRRHWCNGNKNEVILVVGHSAGEVEWADTVSWGASEELRNAINNAVVGGSADALVVSQALREQTATHWKYQGFSKFDYIEVMTPWWAWWLGLTTTAIAVIGVNVWIVRNEYEYRY